jgi:hypothetical protein
LLVLYRAHVISRVEAQKLHCLRASRALS